MIATLALSLFAKPELFIGSDLASFALHHFAKSYQPDWSALTFKIHSQSFTEKSIEFESHDFCFENKQKTQSWKAEACFRNIDLAASFRLSLSGFQILEIQKLILDGQSLRLDTKGANLKEATAAADNQAHDSTGLPSINFLIPSFHQSILVKDLSLQIPQFEWIRSEDSKLAGNISILRDSSDPSKLNLHLTAGKAESLSQFDANAVLESDLLKTGQFSFARLSANIVDQVEEGPQKTSDELHFSIDLRRFAYFRSDFNLEASALYQKNKLDLRLDGSETDSRFELRPTSYAKLKAASGLEAVWSSIELQSNLRAMRPQNFKLSSRIEIRPHTKNIRENHKSFYQSHFYASANFKDSLKSDQFDSDLKLNFDPENIWKRGLVGEISSSLSGHLFDLKNSVHYECRLKLSLAYFKDLVERLQNTSWSVPAPLNALNGSIGLEASSKGEQSVPSPDLDFRITTNLHSEKQKIDSEVSGKISATRILSPLRQIRLDADVLLKKVSLNLPYLNLAELPQLGIDKRILSAQAFENDANTNPEEKSADKSSKTSNLTYQIKVKTESPILIYSNLAKTPVPINVDLLLESGQPVSGPIRIGKFDIQAFRQIAEVNHINLKEAPNGQISLEGLILYKHAEITIRLLLSGTLEKPHLDIESDPPLSQSQIVSVLLFGKSPEDLDSDESASVGTMNSALASGAFGLASLYLFASTPIEYVGFDPVTQSYRVKIKLPSGMSVELGSSESDNWHLTWRKRLSSHWRISTELRHEIDSDQNTISTFLEWFRRF